MPLASYTTYAGYTVNIIFPPSSFSNAWTVHSTYLQHEKNVKNNITKTIPLLKIGTYYKITYEVFDYINCSVQLRVGSSQLGQIASANGFYTDYFMIDNDIDKKFTFISDGLLKVRGLKYEEKVIETELLPFDGDQFENKSWTISYSFHTDSWVSWHSYIPNYYIHSQNNFYAYKAGINSLFKHNQEGKFQTFFGVYYPFIVEYVSLASPLEDKIFEDLTIQTKAKRYDVVVKAYLDERYITFNKLIIFNNRQCSGEWVLKVKDENAIDASNWLFQQINNQSGVISINRDNRNWNINELRDYIIDYTKPFFTTAWGEMKPNYFIDKVLNNNVISFFKSWDELENFRDKFIVIRLKFDTFDDVNLTFNYSLETEQSSNT